MARDLSIKEYAAVGLLYAFQIGVASFAGVGIVEVVIAALKDHRSDSDKEQLFRTAVTMFVVTAALVGGAARLIAQLFKWPIDLGNLEIVSAIAAGTMIAFSALQGQLLRLREQHRRSLSFSFLLPGSIITTGSAAYIILGTIKAFFVGEMVGGAAMLVALRMFGMGYWALHIRNPFVWRTLRKIFPFTVIAVFGWLSGYGANFLINMMVTESEVAKYTFLFTLGSIMQLVSSSFNMVWSPSFYSAVHRDSARTVEEANRKYFLLLGLVLGGVGWVTMAFLPVVGSFLASRFINYKTMIFEAFMMFAGYVLLIPWWHCQNYYFAFDKGRELRNNVIATGVVGVAVWIWAIGVFGPIGIYVGLLLQMVCRSFGALYDAKRFWDLRISWEGVLGGLVLCAMGVLCSRIWR
jgi:O-antigen/teichoic acid export membrane protein